MKRPSRLFLRPDLFTSLFVSIVSSSFIVTIISQSSFQSISDGKNTSKIQTVAKLCWNPRAFLLPHKMQSQILDTGQGGASQQLNYFPVLNPSLYEAEPHLERTETQHQIFASQSSPAISAQTESVIANQRDEPQLLSVMQTSEFRIRLKDLELGGEPGSNSKLQVSLCQTELVFISKPERKMKCEKEVQRRKRRKQQKAAQHYAPGRL